jgi:hypothetical protein
VNLEQKFYEIADYMQHCKKNLQNEIEIGLKNNETKIDITEHSRKFNEFIYFCDCIEKIKNDIKNICIKVNIELKND